MDKILEDIRVADLTDHVFGPYYIRIIAAHGGSIEVEFKVEEVIRFTKRFSADSSDIY